MPEGDSILRIANRLAPRITGAVIERATTQGLPRDLAGRTITAVSTHGKHLVIELDNGDQLRAHLGMNGRTRIYDRAAGEAVLAKLSPGRATLALVTRDTVAIWINARTIEVAPRRGPMRGVAVAQLGPDVLADDFDAHAAATRASEHADRTLADVLLDQRVVAGIGNIWKCEACFAGAVDPRTRVSAVPHDQLATVYRAAHDLMRASVAAKTRAYYTVYSRTGQPCPRCGAKISCYQLGDPPRWTWSCPRCQLAPAH